MRRGLVLIVLVVLAASASEAEGARPLRTAVYPLSSDLTATGMRRIRATGAHAVRLTLTWSQVAQARPLAPEDPADPAYDWTKPDRLIALARANGLEPLLTVVSAPGWAGGLAPSPGRFGQFARAAATRYSGTYAGPLRVRYWLAWNEPNLFKYLAPQRSGRRLVAAERYRRMVNAFADAVHAVRRDNVVVAGLVAPFTSRYGTGPLKFMRAVLRAPVRFDVWAVHPYTSGGPTRHAFNPDDVSLGDVPEVRTLLRKHRPGARLWVTEFSWDSKPPDPRGVPARLEGRWVAEGLYRMWRTGVSLMTWYSLRDEPRPGSPFQSGLYFRGWRAKPALRAFRFPFVAFRHPGRISVWGRTPGSDRRDVVIERSAGAGWRRLAVLRANRHGTFSASLGRRSKAAWSLRARLAGRRTGSLPFALKRPPDRFVQPFGS